MENQQDARYKKLIKWGLVPALALYVACHTYQPASDLASRLYNDYQVSKRQKQHAETLRLFESVETAEFGNENQYEAATKALGFFEDLQKAEKHSEEEFFDEFTEKTRNTKALIIGETHNIKKVYQFVCKLVSNISSDVEIEKFFCEDEFWGDKNSSEKRIGHIESYDETLVDENTIIIAGRKMKYELIHPINDIPKIRTEIAKLGDNEIVIIYAGAAHADQVETNYFPDVTWSSNLFTSTPPIKIANYPTIDKGLSDIDTLTVSVEDPSSNLVASILMFIDGTLKTDGENFNEEFRFFWKKLKGYMGSIDTDSVYQLDDNSYFKLVKDWNDPKFIKGLKKSLIQYFKAAKTILEDEKLVKNLQNYYLVQANFISDPFSNEAGLVFVNEKERVVLFFDENNKIEVSK